jgi:hypothetical protein
VEIEEPKPKRPRLAAPKYDSIMEGIKVEYVSPVLERVPPESPSDGLQSAASTQLKSKSERFLWEDPNFGLELARQEPFKLEGYIQQPDYVVQSAPVTQIQTLDSQILEAEYSPQSVQEVLTQLQSSVKEEELLMYGGKADTNNNQCAMDDNQVFGQFLLSTAYLDIEPESSGVITARQ